VQLLSSEPLEISSFWKRFTVLLAFTHYISLFFMFSCLYDSYVDCYLSENKLQAAESKLSKFVEDIIVPPRMIDIIVDGEVIIYIFHCGSFQHYCLFVYLYSCDLV